VHALWYCNSFDLIGLIEFELSVWPKAVCIYDVKLALEVEPGTNEEKLPEGKLAVIIVAPMLFTNVLSTSLIAWKAWCAPPPHGKTIFSPSSALLTDTS
jgi:hypothetical protein